MGGASAKLKNIDKEDPKQTWVVIGDLGSGTYGKVHKVRNRANGTIAAAKIAPIASDDKLGDFATEVNILVGTRHQNITNFVAGYYFEGNLWILIELAAGGSINDIMRKRGSGLDESQIRSATYQLCSALAFLHDNSVMHRDLNASNVLLAEGGLVKIADFGVSAKMGRPTDRRSSFIGSPMWMAPEVIACEKDRSKPYDNRADIWSLGVTLIEFAEMKAPNSDLHPMKALFKITAGAPPTLTQPDHWSPDFALFLKSALMKVPDSRPAAIDLVSHPFCRSSLSPEPLRILYDRVMRGEFQASAPGSSVKMGQEQAPPPRPPKSQPRN